MLIMLKMMQDKYTSCKFLGETYYIGRIAKHCSMISLLLRHRHQERKHWFLQNQKTLTHENYKYGDEESKVDIISGLWHLAPNYHCKELI
jgi:hypothetical protein